MKYFDFTCDCGHEQVIQINEVWDKSEEARGKATTKELNTSVWCPSCKNVTALFTSQGDLASTVVNQGVVKRQWNPKFRTRAVPKKRLD